MKGYLMDVFSTGFIDTLQCSSTHYLYDNFTLRFMKYFCSSFTHIFFVILNLVEGDQKLYNMGYSME